MAKAVSTKAPEVALEYEIIDASVKPDGAGRMGGERVTTRDGKRFVKFTHSQARWYLEHGTIKRV